MDMEVSSAARIGTRIKKIRNDRELTRAELGEMVSLDAHRIQQYENGTRRPKSDLLKAIASALNVSIWALADPVSQNSIGAMYAMFEMEQSFGMRIEKHPQGFCLVVDYRSEIYTSMREWFKIYTQTQTKLQAAASDEDIKEIMKNYHNWKWTFPDVFINRKTRLLDADMLIDKVNYELDAGSEYTVFHFLDLINEMLGEEEQTED